MIFFLISPTLSSQIHSAILTYRISTTGTKFRLRDVNCRQQADKAFTLDSMLNKYQ